MFSRNFPIAGLLIIVVLAISISLTGCGGGDNDLLPPANDGTINVTTPSSGGPVPVNPSEDKAVHLQPYQHFSLDVLKVMQQIHTAAGTVFTLSLTDHNGTEVQPVGKEYCIATPGRYTATATIEGSQHSITLIIVVDQVDWSAVHFVAISSLIGNPQGSYWDAMGFHTHPGCQFVFSGRWYNDHVPGLWNYPDSENFTVNVPPSNVITGNGGTWTANQLGTITVSMSVTAGGHHFSSQLTVFVEEKG